VPARFLTEGRVAIAALANPGWPRARGRCVQVPAREGVPAAPHRPAPRHPVSTSTVAEWIRGVAMRPRLAWYDRGRPRPPAWWPAIRQERISAIAQATASKRREWGTTPPPGRHPGVFGGYLRPLCRTSLRSAVSSIFSLYILSSVLISFLPNPALFLPSLFLLFLSFLLLLLLLTSLLSCLFFLSVSPNFSLSFITAAKTRPSCSRIGREVTSGGARGMAQYVAKGTRVLG